MSQLLKLLKTTPRPRIPFIVHSNPHRYVHSMNRRVKDQIELDHTETKIRDLLMEYCNHYNKSIENTADHMTLRITGGWVRDKLLGDVSHDLDIAVNFMSGEEFVTRLTEFLQQFHPDLSLSAIHTIKKNPEKSKHLETCTTKIYGLDIDFVNLRSEKYSVDSRIPIIECGTAEEDALRRDATLNALFYNLNQQKIEDFTKRGLDDLKNGILRTPLKPLQTFLDDPLRVLRLIRFASRFNFVIEEETLAAMKDSEIKSSLLHKISRERVGVELDKILTSENPEYGLRLLNFVGISDTVFNIGTVEASLDKFNSAEVIEEYYALNKQMFTQINVSAIVCPMVKQAIARSNNSRLIKAMSGVSQKVFWETMALIPFRNFHLRISPKRSGLVHAPECVLKEGLRFGKTDFEPVSVILQHLDESKPVFERLLAGDIKRSEIGLYLRTFDHYMLFNILINCFNEITSLDQPYTITKPEPGEKFEFSGSLGPILEKYEQILQTIEELDLLEVNTLKPIIDGKTISKELNKKPGPWMAQVTQQVLVWQLDNPNGTREECLEYLASC